MNTVGYSRQLFIINRCPASELFAFPRMRFVAPSTADIDACRTTSKTEVSHKNIGLEYPGTGTETETWPTLWESEGEGSFCVDTQFNNIQNSQDLPET